MHALVDPGWEGSPVRTLGRFCRALAFLSSVKDSHIVCFMQMGLPSISSTHGVPREQKQSADWGAAIGAIVIESAVAGVKPRDSEGLSMGRETGGTASSIPGAGCVEGTSLVTSLIPPGELAVMRGSPRRECKLRFFRDPVQ